MRARLTIALALGIAGLVHCSVKEIPDPGALPPADDAGPIQADGGTPDASPDASPAPAPETRGARIAGEACDSDGQCVTALFCVAGFCEKRFAGDTGKKCATAADCASGICLAITGGQVCSTPCTSSASCVPGWSCGDRNGVQACLCNASPETCNGQDDDCDGVVDNTKVTNAACLAQDTTDAGPGSPSGRACIAGACGCPEANRCGDACVDLMNASAHCGSCTIACDTAQQCRAGKCDCLQTQTNCGGTCIDNFTPKNCGGCDKVCATGSACTATGCKNPSAVVGMCAIVDGTVRCWGDNTIGEIGDGTAGPYDARLSPGLALDLVTATHIASTGATNCARIANGSVWCWGDGTWGALGDGDYDFHERHRPGLVPGVTNATSVASSTSQHGIFCALLADKTVSCWGGNILPNSPKVVDGLADVKKIVGGFTEWCALRTDGTLSCFQNPFDAIGEWLTDVVDVVATSNDTWCALLGDSTVTCWGEGGSGELGNGGGSSATPVVPTGLSGVTQISLIKQRACALLSDKTVKCWGRDPGNDQLLPQPTPVPVSDLLNVTQIAQGCALLGDKTVKCWGPNTNGDLGISDTAAYAAHAVTVPGLTDVVELFDQSYPHCARRTDGGVWCWGNNTADGSNQPGPHPAGPIAF